MLTRWLTFTAVLASSAYPERAAAGRGALTVAPTSRVKGHLEAELTLNCGNRKNAGAVQYWHTPFGYYQSPGSHSELDPVFMHHDGSLVVPNTSVLHSGLYYCLLQHTEGATLWPYQLHVGHDSPQNQDHSEHKQRDDAFRVRRDVGSVKEQQGGVSDGVFAGAVAGSVLLTFVLGFSAGALSRTHVLRCLGALTRKLGRQTDTPDRGSVTMTNLPPMYENQVFEVEQVCDDDDSVNFGVMETTTSSTTSCPPAKPQRSFREKRQEEETTAYLEGCDYMKEEKGREEEEVGGRGQEEKNKGCDGEEEEQEEEERGFSSFYLSEDGGSQTNEDECSEGEEERGRRKEVQEAGEQENMSKEDREERTGGEEEACGHKETGRDEEEEVDDGKEMTDEEEVDDEEKKTDEKEEEVDDGEKKKTEEEVVGGKEKGRDKKEEEVDDGEEKTEDRETDTGSEDDETDSKEGGASSSPRRRVIRLYQYDESGQRYRHLPDPAPNEPGPAPRLKQRSLSLTRLNAIMAAASAGPMDTRETGREERPHFHMEI